MRQQGAIAHRMPVMRLLPRPSGARCRSALSPSRKNFPDRPSCASSFQSRAQRRHHQVGFPNTSLIS
jgi:hypothetical protein